MFRQVSIFALVVLVAVGSLAMPGCSKRAERTKPDTEMREPTKPDVARQEAGAGSKAHNVLKELAIDLGNGLKLEMVLIPAGEFLMGSPDSDEDAFKYEKPQHKVRITKPFYLGKYLVTQEQWESLMGNNPSRFKGPKNPVEDVSWDDCQQLLEKLNKRQGNPAGKFVLPTEAQWEYACRAGSKTRYCFGDDASKLGEYAWYRENSGNATHPVGEKKPNGWGLYDMHGNVPEWCQDWYDGGYYAKSPTDDPTGPATGWDRVIRGSSWGDPAWGCRSAYRIGGSPGRRYDSLGLRVSLVPAPTEEPTPDPPKQITNSIGMKLTLVPSGEFMMGNGESAGETAAFFNKTYGLAMTANAFRDEYPQHQVRITKPFYLGTYHVTRGQFRQFVADTSYKTDAEKAEKPGAYGWNPDKKAFDFNEKYSWRNAGFEQTDEHPVGNVSWNDAVAFCKWLSRKEGNNYRLPTEAEWEYACRAGTTTRYYSGDDPETLAKVGNVADAAAKAKFPKWKWTIKASDGYVFTAPVGSFQPNAFGLYDMHGNAWQWCSDWYDEKYYAKSPIDDPTGPDSGDDRVLRGGSWIDWSCKSRSAKRTGDSPGNRDSAGFRVARTY